MCLFTVKKEEEEDHYVANRHVVRREEHYRSSSPRRASRVIVARTSEPRVVVPTPAQYPLPPPRGKVLPVPQPVPIFVEPAPPPPPPPLAPPEVHYVHVSPRSSVSDHSDYRYERREVRYERDYSPTRSHRSHHGDNYEYRYVNGPADDIPRHRRRERSRSRSRSRVGDYYDDDDRERRTNVRVSRKVHLDRDGNRDERY